MNCRNNHRRPIVGIVSPGEMGASLGELLANDGFPVVTTLEQRSPHTFQRCSQAGLRALHTFDEVVVASEIFISLVPPNEAIKVAEDFCRAASVVDQPPLYVEANSISPATVAKIESLMDRCGVPMVDAAIHGLASRLASHGIMYLSGPGATELAATFRGVLSVKTLGPKPGTASLFKMLQGAVAKGLVGLLLEICLATREVGLLDDLLDVCDHSYPGVMEVLQRMLPTVPRHASRRAAEMREVERTMEWLGLRPGMIHELGRLFGLLANSDLPQCADEMDFDAMPVADILKVIASRVSLRRDATARAYASTLS